MFIFVFTLWVFLAPKVFAETHVSGLINTNTLWTLAESPYVVDSGVSIASSGVLTIEPGVVVKFQDANSFIVVNGTLNVNGTSDEKIYFTSIKNDSVGGDTNSDGSASAPASGDWRNIKFEAGSVGLVSHAIIRYGGEGLLPRVFTIMEVM